MAVFERLGHVVLPESEGLLGSMKACLGLLSLYLPFSLNLPALPDFVIAHRIRRCIATAAR